MDINIAINGINLAPTIINSVIVVLVVSLFCMICGMKIKKADPTKSTKGLVLVMEMVFSFLTNFAKDSIGKKSWRYVPFILTMALYLAVANLLGIIGLAPPTSDYSITLALTIITLLYIMISGIVAKGVGKYLYDTYIGDVPKLMLIIFIPINIVGELSKIISLSIRLFGNVASGAVILAIVTHMLSWISLPLMPVLNAYFDVFAGLMQTAIFCVLMMMWLRSATVRE